MIYLKNKIKYYKKLKILKNNRFLQIGDYFGESALISGTQRMVILFINLIIKFVIVLFFIKLFYLK